MGNIDLDAIRKLHEQMEKKGKGKADSEEFLKNFFQIKEGKNFIRILPAKDERNPFFARTVLHRVKTGTKDSDVKNVHCLRLSESKDGNEPSCPLCDLYYSLWTDIPTDENIARGIKPTSRYYLNVLSRTPSEDGVPNVPKILSIPETLMKIVINTAMDPDYGNVTDVKSGYDFTIVKTMEKSATGIWPKYGESSFRPKPSPLGTPKEVAAIMETLHDIHTLVKHQTFKEVNEIAENIKSKTSLRASKVEVSEIKASAVTEESSDTEENYLEKLKGTK